MTETQTEIINYFIRQGLDLIPLVSVVGSECACGNPKCHSPGKHPLKKYNWKILASADPKKINSWFGSSGGVGGKKPKQEANIGIATGRKSKVSGRYLTCVDVDLTEHEILAKLRLEENKTFWYETGGGGYHFWYWSDLPVRNSVSLIAHKVDIRGKDGYVVAPPSKHVSGKNYTLGCDLTREIARIPEFLTMLLKESYREKQRSQKEASTSKTKSVPGEIPGLTIEWSKIPVPELRKRLLSGAVIPLGARNVTIHRLLSSDRARGEASRLRLGRAARRYRTQCESPDSVSDHELEQLIASCMAYPAYNNAFERVNELYVLWLKKHHYKITDETINKLVSLDKFFFQNLVPADKPVPLSQIAKVREEFFQDNALKQFSVYRSQLLAKKLESLGFKKVRTSKGNVWKVKFEVHNPSAPCHNEDIMKETLHMADDPTVTQTPTTPTPEEPKIITNTKTGERYRVETVKTKTKRKEHPRDHLYQSHPGYDYGKALREKLAVLDPNTDMDLLAEEKLVQDPEAIKAFVESVKVGDVIGVKHSRHKVVGTTTDGIYVDGEYEDGLPPLLDAGKLDFGRWLGFLEILRRDDKFYGVSEFEDFTVRILHPVDEHGKDIDPPAVPTPVDPATTSAVPAKQSIPKKQNKKVKQPRSK